MVPNVQVCREPGHSPPPLLHQPLVRAVLVDRFVRSACAAYLPVRMRHTRRQSPPRSTVRGIPPAAPSPSWPPPRTFAATPHDAQGTVESYVGNCRKKCSWSGRRTAPGTTQGPARPERLAPGASSWALRLRSWPGARVNGPPEAGSHFQRPADRPRVQVGSPLQPPAARVRPHRAEDPVRPGPCRLPKPRPAVTSFWRVAPPRPTVMAVRSGNGTLRAGRYLRTSRENRGRGHGYGHERCSIDAVGVHWSPRS